MRREGYICPIVLQQADSATDELTIRHLRIESTACYLVFRRTRVLPLRRLDTSPRP